MENHFEITERNGVLQLESDQYILKIDTNKNMYKCDKSVSTEFKKFDELDKDKRYTMSEKVNILVVCFYSLVLPTDINDNPDYYDQEEYE